MKTGHLVQMKKMHGGDIGLVTAFQTWAIQRMLEESVIRYISSLKILITPLARSTAWILVVFIMLLADGPLHHSHEPGSIPEP